MGTVTVLAKQVIEEDLYCLYDADEWLRHMEEPRNFTSLGRELAKAVREACHTDGDTAELTDLLTDRMLALEENPTPQRQRNFRKTVSEWMRDKPRALLRSNAIKICFALDMDERQATDFLRRGLQMPGLNVRRAEEAVYLYCLTNHRPYGTVKTLMDRYNRETKDLPAPMASGLETPGDTTAILTDTLENSVWDTDEDFYRTFLLPEREKFLNFSKTTAAAYYRLKNEMLGKMIAAELAPGPYTTQRTGEDWYTPMAPVLDRFVRDCIKKGLLSLPDSYREQKEVLLFPIIWKKVMALCDKEPTVAREFQKTIPLKSLMVNAFFNLSGVSGGKVSSSLHGVADHFPRAQYLARFERDPQNYEDWQCIRKAIVLLSYLVYVYDWDPQDIGSEKGYYDFFQQLTITLEDCRLPALYYADPFDALVLRSVREFETALDGMDEEAVWLYDPISFFFFIMDETSGD